MNKGIKIGVGLFFVVAVAAAVGLWLISRQGFSAREEPGAIESFIAPRLRRIAIPRDAATAVNPVVATTEAVAEGMAHFADHCAICHANDGSGDTDFGKGLYPKPPDMREAGTQELTDGELYYIIHNGIRFTGMPSFGEADTGTGDTDTWKLVHFIRHLPELTPEEVEQMEELNPKSPEEFRREEEARRFLRGEEVEPGKESSESPKHAR
jgi:mono/diheme cytochrome c family protein